MSRFVYESESEYYSSCKNHKSESEYSGFGEKDSNPNPNRNIRYWSNIKHKCFLKNCQFFVLLKGIGESQVCQGDQVGQISKETFCQTRYPKYPCLGSFGSLGSLGIYKMATCKYILIY